jgi:hypothetical protein
MNTAPAKPSGRGRAAFAISAMAIVVFWLVVLPWLSNWPPHRRALDWLDEEGLDPSDMFYTEVEAMTPILDRVNRELTGQPPVAQVSASNSGR